MKSRFVQLLLLLSMTFSVLHAAVISESEACSHACHYTDIDMQSDTQPCSKFCDVHHLFHLSAILASFTELVPLSFSSLKPDANHLRFHPLFYENTHRPPKA